MIFCFVMSKRIVSACDVQFRASRGTCVTRAEMSIKNKTANLQLFALSLSLQ